MKFTRPILAVVLSLTMILFGCSASWVSTLDSILAAAAPALVNILQIVAVFENKPINAALAQKVNADAATIKQLASDFASASASTAPSVCQQLNAAVGVYTQDEQSIIALAQVSDPAVQQKIVVLSGLVASTIAAVTAVIPACNASMMASKSATKPPVSVRSFAANYNDVLVAKTGNAAVDRLTPQLKLPHHSAFVHVVTFGYAK